MVRLWPRNDISRKGGLSLERMTWRREGRLSQTTLRGVSEKLKDHSDRLTAEQVTGDQT